jgi:hypothetical protein
MASKTPKDATGWRSSLEDYPDHVKAIGMISIENANLEFAMAGLFGRTCFIPLRIALAIYLTPKSAIARLEIFQNAAKVALRPRGDEDHRKKLRVSLRKVNRIAERAKTVIGKRHGIIHDAWGVDRESKEVLRAPPARPILDQKVPLKELKELISEFRRLIDDVDALRDEFRDSPSLVDMREAPRDKNP